MNPEEQTSRQTQWQALVEEHEKSGLSQKEFCKQRNLVLYQFVYYRGKIKSKEQNNSSTISSFAPVQIKQPSSVSAEIRVILPNGFQCYFPCHLEPTYIKKFMETLLSC